MSDPRVEKLRRLAASTTFPGERDAANAKADQLEARAPKPPPLSGTNNWDGFRSTFRRYPSGRTYEELLRSMRRTAEAMRADVAAKHGEPAARTIFDPVPEDAEPMEVDVEPEVTVRFNYDPGATYYPYRDSGWVRVVTVLDDLIEKGAFFHVDIS